MPLPSNNTPGATLENSTSGADSSPVSSRRAWAWWLLQFPITRIVLALILVLVPIWLSQAGLKKVRAAAGLHDSLYVKSLGAYLVAMVACLGYAAYVRLIERRAVTELGRSGAVTEFLTGALIGTALMAATVGVLAVLGMYRVAELNSPVVCILPLALGVMSGIVEEILARAIVFRITEEWFGSWIALTLSAALFGYAHAANPGATIASSVAIALEAGVLLAAAFMLTRRLWLAVGIHTAWNFTQSGIFGIAVSGGLGEGLLLPRIAGPEWLTGGAFGVEASVVAVLFCMAAAIVVLIRAIRRKHVIGPNWKLRPRSAGSISPSPKT